MLTLESIDQEISETVKHGDNRADVSYLSCLYTIRDHMAKTEGESGPAPAGTVREYGDSDFLRAVAGMDPARVWAVMDELMDTVRLIQPRLYDSVMDEIGAGRS